MRQHMTSVLQTGLAPINDWPPDNWESPQGTLTGCSPADRSAPARAESNEEVSSAPHDMERWMVRTKKGKGRCESLQFCLHNRPAPHDRVYEDEQKERTEEEEKEGRRAKR
ncbi:unnamed protein product [Pleuronectes platessa]|uniref:Uncharacterized protein n=1 Tax=Pleuronectes platessa TaxID=8262 RepID=A0A9N7W4R8_PLEPL|nr:unnamed protein product [Pleuronectes platessa]